MSIDRTAADLMAAMQPKPTPSAYDTQATVTRVDGDTLWVHIPGGTEETPIQRTVGASVGDQIQIRVGGGTAWATGNASAPPTDDTRANEAVEKIAEIDRAKIGWAQIDDLFAQNITATGSFFVDNPIWTVKASGTGIRLGAQKEGDILGSYLDIQYAVSLMAGDDLWLSASRGAIRLIAYLGGIEVGGDLIPYDYNRTYNLGSTSTRWRTLYAGAVDINGNPAVAKQTKTVSGTTSANANIALGINSTYGILSVRDTATSRLCIPYCSAGGAWYAKICAISDMSPAANAAVTLEVDYYAK